MQKQIRALETTELFRNPQKELRYALGEKHGGGNGHPLQYSCLGNPMDIKYPRRRALIEELQRLTGEVRDEKRKPCIEQLSIEIA